VIARHIRRRAGNGFRFEGVFSLEFPTHREAGCRPG
jgi:hypothetical protein